MSTPTSCHSPPQTAPISSPPTRITQRHWAGGPLHPWTGGSSCRWCVLCRGGGVSRCLRIRVSGTSRALDPRTGIPGLPDWECIPTPGHTPGHVSFFRPSDRVLITGDALVTVNLNCLWGFLLWGFRRNKQMLSGPPWYTTWSWRAAKESVASVARVEPRVLATGHGMPMTGPTTARDVRAFAKHFR